MQVKNIRKKIEETKSLRFGSGSLIGHGRQEAQPLKATSSVQRGFFLVLGHDGVGGVMGGSECHRLCNDRPSSTYVR